MIASRVFAAFAAVAATLAVPLGAAAQSSTAETVAEIGGWTIAAVSVDGAHLRCTARPSATPQLSLEKSSEGWTVVVPSAATGDEVKGAVDVDGKSFAGVFYLMDDGRVGLFLDAGRVKRIGAGRRLAVTIAGVTTAVSLDGVGAVLKRTAACDAAAE
jgi:hypothetical protein